MSWRDNRGRGGHFEGVSFGQRGLPRFRQPRPPHFNIPRGGQRPNFSPRHRFNRPPGESVWESPPDFHRSQSQDEEQVWIEAEAPDGKVYFYHSVSRETTWEPPIGPNVIIVPLNSEQNNRRGDSEHQQNQQQPSQQQSPQGPSQSQQQQPFFHGPPPNIQGGPPRHLGPPGPGGMGLGPPPGGMLGPQGPPPFEEPRDGKFPPGPMMFPPPLMGQQNPGAPPGSKPFGENEKMGMGFPGFGVPPPGIPPFIPPWGMGNVPTGVPPPTLQGPKGDWTEHVSPDGKTFYFNTKTNQSSWERPQEFPHAPGIEPERTKEKFSPMKKSDGKKEEKGEKCRPISSTPVPGTPWCVVWTGDKRAFFYNPSNKSSVWDRPRELIGRVDVDELLVKCPSEDTGVKKAEATSTTSPVPESDVEKPQLPVQNTPTPEADLDSPEPITVPITNISEEPAEKRPKVESEDRRREVNALEAEVKAAKERAVVPLETRLAQFRDMLEEKAVSAFSTWEKELHKIVFDPRYLLLTSKERKAAFDSYVKERAEEERREKKNRARATKDTFFRFLKEIVVSPKMSFGELQSKWGKDERLRAVEKSRDREAFFAEFMADFRRKDKKTKESRMERERENFLVMLKEKVEDYHIKWAEMKGRLEGESRGSALDLDEREELFKLFQKTFKADTKAREKRKKRKRRKRDKGAEEDEEGALSTESDDEERQRKERAEFSLREREKVVQRTLAGHLRERDKERETHRHEEAVVEFQALLTDLVRGAQMEWKEVKRRMKKDRRYTLVSLLPKDEMEDLFHAHTDGLTRKKRIRFRELLKESGVDFSTNWSDIRRRIRDDPRYIKYTESSDRKGEREFEAYLKELGSSMKSEFRELLKESKMLTYKTKAQVRENPSMMKDLESLLSKDKRYLQMSDMVEDRRRLLVEFLDELERKGPPPPPTASEPTRRLKT